MVSHSDNKRLAKNTLVLYVRMVLTIVIGLYTSRVILNALGVSDFGIFNVVGGVVSLFSFFNTALTGGTQRFLSFAFGKGKIEYVRRVFQVAFGLHISIAITFFFLMEVLGILILNYVLNIPENRDYAAVWVFHCCTLAVCIDLLRMLFDADVIANEKMTFYAYISIFEVSLKLLIVYILTWQVGFDKLKLYSLLYLISAVLMLMIAALYCRTHFKEARLKVLYDKSLIKEIGVYTSWNVFSHLSFMVSQHGINIALNVFFNTIMNAARGISVQIYGALIKLTNNYLFATMPQIVKLYAAGNIAEMYNLVKNVSRFSVYLYLIVAVPLLLEMDYILQLWLVEVPPHTVSFSRILVINGLILSLSNPISRILTAAGKIREINVFDFISQLISFAALLFLFFIGVGVDWAMCIIVGPSILGFFNYLYNSQVHTGINASDYFVFVIPQVAIVTIMSIILPIIVHIGMEQNFIRLLIVVLTSLFSIVISVYLFGINKETRYIVNNKIVNIVNKLYRH